MMNVEEDLAGKAKPQGNLLGIGKFGKAPSDRILSRHPDFEHISHAKLWQNRKKDDFVFVGFLTDRHPLSVRFRTVSAKVSLFKDWQMVGLENIRERLKQDLSWHITPLGFISHVLVV